MRLNRLKTNLNLLKEEQNNEHCESCSGKRFVWDYAKGDVICEDCGVVSLSGLPANDNHDRFSCSSAGNSGMVREQPSARCITDPIYVRYFHFNEVLATLTLEGPWINNADFREIRNSLRTENISDPNRGDVQRVCQLLNKKYNVQRFTKKYTEKWIQVVYRYNGKRPPVLHPNLVEGLRNDFKTMVNRWTDLEKLLTVSKKRSEKRVQWPNYLETIYRLLKLRYPEMLEELRPWITRLSPKKRKELKSFFIKAFRLVGWLPEF